LSPGPTDASASMPSSLAKMSSRCVGFKRIQEAASSIPKRLPFMKSTVNSRGPRM
jgi:hypothetical protein